MMRATPSRLMRFPRAGSILILVVWVIALLSILAAGLGSRGAFALGVGQRLMFQLRESYVALAASQDVAHLLATDATPEYDGLKEEWANSRGTFEERQVGASGLWTIRHADSDTGEAIFGLVDEERKLNLNTAPEAVFQRLLEQVALMKEHDAHVVAEALVDWRDTDKNAQPEGAEDFYYAGLPEAYESKDGPFENVEELLLLKGMTPDVYLAIAPYVTTYGSGKVNLNTAPKVVLRVLGLSEEGVQGLLTYRVGEDGAANTGDDRMLPSLSSVTTELANLVPQEDLNRILAASELFSVSSQAFQFLLSARLQGASYSLQVNGVISRTGQLLAWRER